jgi:hypothetical protein
MRRANLSACWGIYRLYCTQLQFKSQTGADVVFKIFWGLLTESKVYKGYKYTLCEADEWVLHFSKTPTHTILYRKCKINVTLKVHVVKETLSTLVRDLFTFSSKVIKMFMIV